MRWGLFAFFSLKIKSIYITFSESLLLKPPSRKRALKLCGHNISYYHHKLTSIGVHDLRTCMLPMMHICQLGQLWHIFCFNLCLDLESYKIKSYFTVREHQLLENKYVIVESRNKPGWAMAYLVALYMCFFYRKPYTWVGLVLYIDLIFYQLRI